jgi:hypothetical protein
MVRIRKDAVDTAGLQPLSSASEEEHIAVGVLKRKAT